jgi:hypothetical protein
LPSEAHRLKLESLTHDVCLPITGRSKKFKPWINRQERINLKVDTQFHRAELPLGGNALPPKDMNQLYVIRAFDWVNLPNTLDTGKLSITQET